MRHLILVPGHAVWGLTQDPSLDAAWHLKPFQNREPRFFLEHIQAAVLLAAADPSALLLFSGNATDEAAGPVSEALSYFLAAERLAWFGQPAVRARAALEEFACDSYQNLEFSLHRFHQLTNRYPDLITVSGWAFKHPRFVQHAQALGFAGEFQGLCGNAPENLAEAEAREAETRHQYLLDPRGLQHPLAAKRAARNPFRRLPSYDLAHQGWRPARAPGEIW